MNEWIIYTKNEINAAFYTFNYNKLVIMHNKVSWYEKITDQEKNNCTQNNTIVYIFKLVCIGLLIT